MKWNKPKTWRWPHWLGMVSISLYIVYVALAYGYLPGKLKQVVEKDVSALVGRDISAERFAFNPFTFVLDSYGVKVPDKPDRPLLGWHHIQVNFSPWRSLFHWQLEFQSLRLDGVAVNIERTSNGFNFSDILAQLESNESATSEESIPEAETQLALEITEAVIVNSHFYYGDNTGAQKAETTLDNIAVTVKDLYIATGDERLNPFNISASLPGNGDLSLKGQYRIAPLFVQGEVNAKSVQLSEFSDYLENEAPMAISNGELTLSAEFMLENQEDFQFALSRGQLQLDNLAVDDATLDPPMLRVKQVELNNIVFNLLEQSIAVDLIESTGVHLHQWLDETGNVRYQSLLAEEVVAENQQRTEKQQGADALQDPWKIELKKIHIGESRIEFEDKNPAITTQQTLANIDLTVEQLNFNAAQDTHVSLLANLNDQAALRLQGAMSLVPFSMTSEFDFKNIPLANISEYLEELFFLKINRGALSAAGKIELDTEQELSVFGTASVALDDFQIDDTRNGSSLFAVDQLAVNGVNFDVSNQTLSNASIEVIKPRVNLVLSEDHQLNLATLVRPNTQDVAPSATEDSQTESGEVSPWQITLATTKVAQGSVGFRDESIKPVFKTELVNIELAMESLSTNQTEMTPFTLQSSFDQYAPFTIKGQLAPLSQQPGFTFTSDLRGVEMPRLTPYVATYIGNEVQSGQLSLDLDYSLNERRLKGTNNIVAKNFYLGKEVASEQAINAPVALGLALLRDRKGVIDVDVNVAGDIDEPGFSVSGIVLKALVNLIVKAATSPFQLLGSLVGGEEDLGTLEFAPGSAELSAENQTKLEQLVAALAKRPQLGLKLVGNGAAEVDGNNLREQSLIRQVAQLRKLTEEQLINETDNQEWWQQPDNQKTLKKLNGTLDLPSFSQREEVLRQQQPAIAADEIEKILADQMYQDLVVQQPLSESQILALADQRALTIKQYLVVQLQLAADRVALNKTTAQDLKGRMINLELTPL